MHKRAPVFWRFIVYRFKKGERYGLGFTLAFLGILLALWGFLLIVESVTDQESIYHLDRVVQEAMAPIHTPEMTRWVVFITDLGGTRGTVVGVVIVGLVLLFTRRWWSLFGLVFASAGGGAILFGLKFFFQRARPAEQVISVGGYSFPSGHAFAAMVFFGYLIYLSWRLLDAFWWRTVSIVFCATMIVLIGVSRVYLNVHWFTDVLGGFTAGFSWLAASILIIHLIERRPASLEPPPEASPEAPPEAH